MDLKEAEDIKKRWQEYTEELYKKDLHDQDNHFGMTNDFSILIWSFPIMRLLFKSSVLVGFL